MQLSCISIQIMTKKLIGIIVVAIFAIIFAFILKNKTDQKITNSSPKLQISTSFYPLYFFTTQIVGDKGDVKNITPVGGEPHDYEPTPQDIVTIQNGKLLILNGGGLEVWADKIKDQLKDKNVQVLVVGEDLANQQVEEEGKNIQDPHIWLSPPLAKKMAGKIAQAIENVDPANKDYYEQNKNKLESRLDRLDSEYKQGLSNCKNINIITSHAAFGYLASTYGLKQVPISGLSPDAEPSAQQLAEVTKFARENNVKYIFFETLVSPKLAKTIAKEIGAQTLVLNPIEGLTDDEIKAGKSYTTVMEDNLKNLQIALECN